ncbi:YkgJ family cysteine cluster protein [Ampullimonas aquatilis]|uniref:YkgJ family cysteine cluster protein n=1 Tax=Ampullimonas aquatilis TaxID=1341549 RepID=UPI003C7098B5
MLTPEEHALFLSTIAKIQVQAQEQLLADTTPAHTVHFITRLHGSVDQLSHKSQQEQTFACQAGCSYCCHVRVEALEPEIFLIARTLRQESLIDQFHTMQRLQAHVNQQQAAKGKVVHQPCPFLVNQMCSIYLVRPAVCRKAHSLDVQACATQQPQLPQNLAMALGAEALMKGTAYAYQSLELSASGHELAQSVLLAMQDDMAEQRWLAGEPVFKE